MTSAALRALSLQNDSYSAFVEFTKTIIHVHFSELLSNTPSHFIVYKPGDPVMD